MIVDGRYRVLQTIRDSDDHAEYLTEHQLIGRRLVVKVLHAQAAGHAELVMRFVAEAEAAGKLRHPNIVESIDMGFVDNRPFVVFEHLHGSRVAEEIDRIGRMPVRRAVHIARQVAAALGAAHLEDILHGGLDSDQVYLVDRETDPDFVKVLGLGQGLASSTTETLSPEQVLGTDLDHRCDVWALGVLLYEMIVGRRPFSADAGSATARRRIVSADPPMIDRSDVPPALVEVIMTCLAKHPDERYQDMAEVDAALVPFDVRFARGSSTTIPPMPLPRLRRPSSPQAVVAIPARTSSMHRARTPSSTDLPFPIPRPTPTPAPIAAAPRRIRPGLIVGLVAATAVCGAGIWLALTRGTERAPAAQAPAVAPVAATDVDPAATAAGARVGQPTDVDFAVDSDTAGARVTFRRRVHAAPVTLAVTPGDMVELVEVSAPGHKTVRYWITIDRTTRINARLVAGAGLVEATELDTLVALGEAAEPAPAVDDARAARAAKPERAHKSRRSIGRRADAPAPDDEPADAPAPVDDAAAAELAAADAAARAETEAAPVAPAPAAAAARTAKAAAPRQVAAGFLEANRIAGNAKILPDNGTRQAMHHQGATRVVGKFKLCVSATGTAGKVSMISSSGYDDYDKKIMAELGRWKFKPISINGEATPVCASIAIAYSQN
jgi:hypothetical protein